MNISLENWIRNKLHENEEMHDYSVATDSIRCWIDEWNASKKNDALLQKLEDITDSKIIHVSHLPELSEHSARFQLPSDKQMIDIAILFNDGKLEQEKLADMVGYAQFIVDRLHENGDVTKPSSKEIDN